MTLQHIRNWVAEIEVAAKDGDFERAARLKMELYRDVLRAINNDFDFDGLPLAAIAGAAEALKAEEFI